MRGCCEELEIDTKDICLLCLGSRIGTTCDDSPPSLASSQGLKHLLRFLKVSPKQLFNCSSEFLQSMEIREDIDLKISLCSKCSSVTEKFNKLYQDYELIQLQFGDCVQTLYQSISKGNESPERVRKYMDQMRPTKSSDLVNASIAANLRNETLKKCSLKLQSVTPRVQVASEKSNVQKLSLLPKADEVAIGSVRSEISIPERETRSTRSLLNTNKPQGSLRIESGTSKIRRVSDSDKVNMKNGSRQKSVSVTFEKEIQLPKPEGTSRRETRSLKSAIKSQFHADYNKLTNELQPEEIQVVSQTNHVTRKPRQRTSYFSSIRKKLKTTTKSKCFRRGVVKSCEYCKATLGSQPSLRLHMAVIHPEHGISKFLPSHVSLELCKQGVHAVLKQMFEVSDRNCQFCDTNLCDFGSLRRHLMSSHAEQFAVKVLENIQSLPESVQQVNQKLTKETMPTNIGINISNSNKETKGSAKFRFACEYCRNIYTSRKSLKNHRMSKHPEHIVYKYFPSHIPLDSCKQGFGAVLEQILQKTSESGFKCKYCTTNIAQKGSFKLHVVYMHAEQIALEAQQYIGLTEHLEAVSPDALECSSTWRNLNYDGISNPSEDVNESTQVCLSLEMDFEEESLVKVENPQSANVELDPLDVDYLD